MEIVFFPVLKIAGLFAKKTYLKKMSRTRVSAKMFQLLDFTPDIFGRIAYVNGPGFDVLRLLAQCSKATRAKLRDEILKARADMKWNNTAAHELAKRIKGKFKGAHEWTRTRVEVDVISPSIAHYRVYGCERRSPDFATLAATVVPSGDKPHTITVTSRFVEIQDRWGDTELNEEINTMHFTITPRANGRPSQSGTVVYNANPPQAYTGGVMLFMDGVLYVFAQ